MIWLIEQKKLSGCNKFVIVPDSADYRGAGIQVPVPGFTLELKNNRAEVTEEEDKAIKEKFGIGIIEKLRMSNDYKAGYLRISEKGASKKGRPKKD